MDRPAGWPPGARAPHTDGRRYPQQQQQQHEDDDDDAGMQPGALAWVLDPAGSHTANAVDIAGVSENDGAGQMRPAGARSQPAAHGHARPPPLRPQEQAQAPAQGPAQAQAQGPDTTDDENEPAVDDADDALAIQADLDGMSELENDILALREAVATQRALLSAASGSSRPSPARSMHATPAQQQQHQQQQMELPASAGFADAVMVEYGVGTGSQFTPQRDRVSPGHDQRHQQHQLDLDRGDMGGGGGGVAGPSLASGQRLAFRSPGSHDDDFLPTQHGGLAGAACAGGARGHKRGHDDSSQDESDAVKAMDCVICMDSCTNSGPHRVVVFRCGHMFGQKCILLWMSRTKKGQPKLCPTCKKPISKSQMIPIFSKNVVVLDTAERDAALLAASRAKRYSEMLERRVKDLEKEVAELFLLRDMYKREADDFRKELAGSKREISRLKRERDRLKSAAANSSGAGAGESEANANLDASAATAAGRVVAVKPTPVLRAVIDLNCTPSSARVVEVCPANQILFVTICDAQSHQHGVLKINLRDTHHRQFIPIHTGTIRDCRVSPVPDDCLLLTTSVDRTLKLTSFRANTVIQTFALDYPGWSCCFDSRLPSSVYVGTSNNAVLQFDTRLPGDARWRLLFDVKNGKGVHSLRVATVGGPTTHDGACGQYLFGSTFDDVFAVPVSYTRLDDAAGLWSSCGAPVVTRVTAGDGGATPQRHAQQQQQQQQLKAICTSFDVEDGTGVWACALRCTAPISEMVYRVGGMLSAGRPGATAPAPTAAQAPPLPLAGNAALAVPTQQILSQMQGRHPPSQDVQPQSQGQAQPLPPPPPPPPPQQLAFTPTTDVCHASMQRTMTRIHLMRLPTSTTSTTSTHADPPPATILQRSHSRDKNVVKQLTTTMLATTDETTGSIRLYPASPGGGGGMGGMGSPPWMSIEMGQETGAIMDMACWVSSTNSSNSNSVSVSVSSSSSNTAASLHLAAIGGLRLYLWELTQ